MLRIQSDEEIIEKLYCYLKKTFNPRLRFEIKKPLRELFPKSENKWLLSIWNYGHADISVSRHNRLICIIEPGGWYHAKDEKQKIRDLKKDKICKINKVNCLRIFNKVVENDLDNPKFKKLLKKYFYGRDLN